MSSFEAIPLELRQLKQWVVWREGKVPYQINGQLADVTNPATWVSFNEAVSALSSLNIGIGFVFTSSDPYSFIDLDNANGDQAILATHLKISHEFNSYSEVSPSGMGLHIIIKGKVQAGRRRSKVEIYSSARYATMTGRVHNNTSINDCQEQLTQLWEQMGSGPVAQSLYNGNDKEEYTDAKILEMAYNAVNGDKFLKLYRGEWRDVLPHIPMDQGPSEADLALINIIAFYTKNRVQIERIFLSSELGKRDKVKRKDYMSWMINKSFDKDIPNIDFDGLKNQLELKLSVIEPVVLLDTLIVTTPPGLLGEIAQFIYNSAPRPVPEVALAAAIGLFSGITGRAYNISGTGLNQYVLLLAMTGAGKEAAASGINKLMGAIRMQVPTSTTFIGPSEISSGSALFKYLGNQSQSFISLLGEFGLRLQQMSSPNANGSEVSLRRMFLDLYNKSGHSEILHASVYSDKANNTSAVSSPSFSILGESTPERFYGALNEDMISEGLLPRFLLLEYKGNRPDLNEHHTSVVPNFSLIEKLAALTAHCDSINHSNPRRVINVQSTSEAAKSLRNFDLFSTNKINSSNKEVIRQLWNRAHIKVLKLSALLAVGQNMTDPVINQFDMEWATRLVQSDIQSLTERFEAGEIGSNSFEVKQAYEIIRVIKDYVKFPYQSIEKYLQFKSQPMHTDKVIPYIYIQRRLVAASAFRNDKAGATVSMKRAIQNLVDADRIRELGKTWANDKYGTSQRCFVVSDTSILD